MPRMRGGGGRRARRRRRRVRRRRVMLVGGLVGFGAYKMSTKDADRIEERKRDPLRHRCSPGRIPARTGILEEDITRTLQGKIGQRDRPGNADRYRHRRRLGRWYLCPGCPDRNHEQEEVQQRGENMHKSTITQASGYRCNAVCCVDHRLDGHRYPSSSYPGACRPDALSFPMHDRDYRAMRYAPGTSSDEEACSTDGK